MISLKIGKSEGNIETGIRLLIIGVVFLLISIFIVGAVSDTVIDKPFNNESLGSMTSNITSFTAAYPKLSSSDTVVRNLSTTMTANNSFDMWGCSNVPCYEIVNRDTGVVNVTLCYENGSDCLAGADGLTDTIYIDYIQQHINSDAGYSTSKSLRTNAFAAFGIAGVVFILMGAALVLGLLGDI